MRGKEKKIERERGKKKLCLVFACEVQEWDDMTMFGDGSAVVPLESLQRYLTNNNDSTMKYEASAGLCSKLLCISPCFRYVVVSCGISRLGGKVVQPDATARACKCVMNRVDT